MLREIHSFVSNIFNLERKLGDIMESMIKDLEEGEVQAEL